MLGVLRSYLFSLLLGFHNAFEQEERAMEELAIRVVTVQILPGEQAMAHPARCFLFGESSLAN